MAMDTASKRSSAINLNSPWRGLWPIPDGAISQGDRQAASFLYAGILAGSAAIDGQICSGKVYVKPYLSGTIRVEVYLGGSIYVEPYLSGKIEVGCLPQN